MHDKTAKIQNRKRGHFFNNFTRLHIENLVLPCIWKVCKVVLLLPFSKFDSSPIKRQSRWTDELNLSFDSVNWLDVYKSNYSATPETKLRSFQVKLNLRAIVANIALHCFDIADSDKCSFCKTERETFLHLFCNVLVLVWFFFGKCFKLD